MLRVGVRGSTPTRNTDAIVSFLSLTDKAADRLTILNLIRTGAKSQRISRPLHRRFDIREYYAFLSVRSTSRVYTGEMPAAYSRISQEFSPEILLGLDNYCPNLPYYAIRRVPDF